MVHCDIYWIIFAAYHGTTQPDGRSKNARKTDSLRMLGLKCKIEGQKFAISTCNSVENTSYSFAEANSQEFSKQILFFATWTDEKTPSVEIWLFVTKNGCGHDSIVSTWEELDSVDVTQNVDGI